MMVRPMADERRLDGAMAGDWAAADAGLGGEAASLARTARSTSARAAAKSCKRRSQTCRMSSLVVAARELDDASGGDQRVVEPPDLRVRIGDDLIEHERVVFGDARDRRDRLEGGRRAPLGSAATSRAGVGSARRPDRVRSSWPTATAHARDPRATRRGGVGTIEVGAPGAKLDGTLEQRRRRVRPALRELEVCARFDQGQVVWPLMRQLLVHGPRFVRPIRMVREEIGRHERAFEAAGGPYRPGRADLRRLIRDASAR